MTRFIYYYYQIKAEIFFIPKNIGYFLTRKKRAIYIGCTGKGNLGDECVYLGIKKLLGEKIYFYPIAFNKPSSGKYLRSLFLKPPNCIILGGGTIIKKNKNESYLKLFLMYHKKYPKAKLIVFGSGVGDPVLAKQVGFPTDEKTWKVILNKCSFIGVRGPLSQHIIVNDWKVNRETTILYDPAIFFLRRKIKPKLKQKKIGINFCNILGRIYGLYQKDVEVFAKDLVQKYLNEKWQVFLFPTTRNDLNYMQSILGKDLVNQVNHYYNYTNLKDSLTFMEDMDVFIGQRLHSVIFAAITYTPFHAIEYESKTSDFLLSLDLKNYSTKTDKLNLEKVFNSINIQYNNMEATQNMLFTHCNKAFQKQLSLNKKFLKEIII